MKYQVFLYNLGFYLQDEYDTYEAACKAAYASGFQFIIEEVDQ